MNITDHERQAIERVREQQHHFHWMRWLGLTAGVLLCVLYWQSGAQLAQWIYSGSTQSGSFPEVKYITMFLLGVYFVVTALAHWRGNVRDRLLLKLAEECGLFRQSQTQ